AKQMTLQRDLLLAECFDQLGDQAAAVLACRRVLALDPQNIAARLQICHALVRLGRTQEALTECQRMTELPAPPPTAWTLMARLLIFENLRRFGSQQTPRWKEVNDALDKAAVAATDSDEVHILRAEAEFAQKHAELAHGVLKKARAKWPGQTRLWF